LVLGVQIQACNSSNPGPCGAEDLNDAAFLTRTSRDLFISSGLMFFNENDVFPAPPGTYINIYADIPDGFSIAAVPEPSTWALLLIGFVGLSFIAYRRRERLAT
jgi:hypothetical protein